MARRARKLHELVPVERDGKAYVWRTKWLYLGKWGDDAPTDEAIERLAQLKQLWAVDPGAKAKVASGLLLIELWRAWEASPECPQQNSRDDFDRVDRLLFGTQSTPGPHAATFLKDFAARDLRAWQTHLCDLKNKSGGLRLSRDTIRQCVKFVRKCFAWGVVEGQVDQLHAASMLLVDPPSKGTVKEKKKRASIDKSVSDKVLPHLTPPLRTAVELLWLTTARPAEVLGLRVEDIKTTGTILLRGGAKLDLSKEKVWAAVLSEHKTADKGFERIIFFGPKSQSLLAPYMQSSSYLFKPADGRASQLIELARKLTTTGRGSKKHVKGEKGERRPGEFYTSHALAKAVGKACNRANVAHFVPYSIRHSASAVVRDAHGTEAAGVYMGHRPRGVTGGYVGNDLKLAARVARKCG